MAWNRNSEGQPSPRPRRAGGRGNELPSALLVILAAVVLLAGGFAWWWARRGGDAGPSAPGSREGGLIAEATPAPAPASKAEPPAPTVNIPKNPGESGFTTNRFGSVVKVYRDERGILRYEGGARVPNPEDFKNPITIMSKSNLPVFRHRVDSEIATLLTMKPGGIIAGVVRYDGLEQDFLDSIADKIEITEEDSPRHREIKQAVIDCRKELIERVKNGESIVDILKESRRELQRLSEYKNEIGNTLRDMLNGPDVTDNDVRAAYEAANKMLEAKGIAPIKFTGILKRRQRMRQ